jgi:hypothetical protein
MNKYGFWVVAAPGCSIVALFAISLLDGSKKSVT